MSGEVLEMVPGLIVTQYAGDGKVPHVFCVAERKEPYFVEEGDFLRPVRYILDGHLAQNQPVAEWAAGLSSRRVMADP